MSASFGRLSGRVTSERCSHHYQIYPGRYTTGRSPRLRKNKYSGFRKLHWGAICAPGGWGSDPRGYQEPV